MPTLSSALVKNQVATMSDVEEALARQVLYGGDLATNLLEATVVDEARLTRVLAECAGAEPAPAGELPRAGTLAMQFVPPEFAVRHAAYPLEADDLHLVLAVAEPLPADIVRDLAFALGVKITQRVAPLVRVRQAIARDYGSALDHRLARLVGRLEGRLEPPQSRGRPGTWSLPRAATIPPAKAGVPAFGAFSAKPSAPPKAATRAEVPAVSRALAPAPPRAQSSVKTELADAPKTGTLIGIAPPARGAAAPPAPAPSAVPETRQSPTLPLPTAAAPVPVVAAEIARAPAPPAPPATLRSSVPPIALGAAQSLAAWARGALPSPPNRPRRGPYTPAMADQDLRSAASRDDVMAAFFHFSAQYFEYAALFVVHADLAEGRDAHGPGAGREAITKIGVPLDLPSALSAARAEGRPALRRLEPSGMDAQLSRDLQRPGDRSVLLLPVMVRNRCVLMLYGDHGSEDVELSAIGDVIALAPLVSAAIERVIVQRKGAARPSVPHERSQGGGPSRPAGRRSDLPSREQRVGALAQLVGASAPPEPSAEARTADEEPAQRASLPSSAPPPPPPAEEVEAYDPDKTPVVSALVRASWTAPLEGAPAEPARVEPAPVDPVGPSAREPEHAFPLTRRTPAGEIETAKATEASNPAVPAPTRAASETGFQVVPASVRGPAPRFEPRDDAPQLSFEPGEVDYEEEGPSSADGGVPLAPPSRSVRVAARALRPQQLASDLELPSVIVEVATDARMLVERLIEGDEIVVQQLRDMGEVGVAALGERFPGPITAEPRAGASAGRASRCGPVLHALVRMGRIAVPFLVSKTNIADAVVRGWATRLLGEIPSTEGAEAIARRFMDPEEDVRRAALAGARLLENNQPARSALREALARLASDRKERVSEREAVINALSALRDPLSVPALISLLQDASPVIGEGALAALVVLTRQDFGAHPNAWLSWWEKNRQRHRIEWLIDTLTHDNPDLRRAAGDELKGATKEYFGYYDDLPRKERARAQQRYREWWQTRGHILFS